MGFKISTNDKKMVNQKTAIKQLKVFEKMGGSMRLAAEKWPSKFQTLISIILSARSRDETTIVIARTLFKKYGTAQKLSKAKIKDVEKIVKRVNFYKNKSRNIINCAKMIVKNYNGRIPKDIDELVKLPGVGRKTANVFLAEYGGDHIGVDTHVSYISQKMKWVKSKTPDKIEIELEKLFPKRYWKRLNSTLVRFGKEHTSRKKKDKLIEEVRKIK